MNTLADMLLLLIPLLVVDLVLAIAAVVHIVKHPQYRFGNKAVWIVIVLVVQLFGPLIYFFIERGNEQ